VARDGSLRAFADPGSAAALSAGDVSGLLRAHLASLREGDYFAINAFVERSADHDRELQALRHAVRDRRRVATSLGYGPRFLHSTGQLHKGGPNRGVFLEIVAEEAEDLAIPGRKISFGVLAQAQARGDFEVLVERGRRALRIQLGPDVPGDLARLREMVDAVL
jgi:hypothetical protein